MIAVMNGLLTELEMANVFGGKKKSDEKKLGTRLKKYCLHCEITGKNMTQHLYRKNGQVYCPECGTVYPELY